mgnify:CR=1 FL=1
MSLVWIMYVHTFTLMNFLQICIVIKQTFPLKMLNKMQMNGIEDQLAEILFYVNFVLGENCQKSIWAICTHILDVILFALQRD